MDKRGQLGINLGLGKPLVFLVITLVLVLAIIFSPTFRIIALSIGLMAMAFFIVTKQGVRRNVKMPIFFILLTIGLVLFFASGVLQSTFNQPSSVFIDKELGMIVTTAESGITQAIFKNTAGSGITVSNVGEKVKICDYFANLGTNYKYTKYDWVTKLGGSTISTTGITGYAERNAGSTYCREWTPTKAGTYEVDSVWTYCPATGGFSCINNGLKVTNSGNTWYCPNHGSTGLVVDGIQICKDNKCSVGTGSCTSGKSSDTKSYYLEVKSAEQTCSKSPYVGSWYVEKTIENGKVMASNVYKVTNDCQYAVNYKNTMTICNSDSLIENSNLRQTEGDNWKCIVEMVDPEVIIDPECNLDLIVSCGDGTSILAKTCSNGFYKDSGLQCSVIGEPDKDDNAEDTTNDNIYDTTTDNGNTEDTTTDTTNNFMQDYGKWIVGGLLGLVVLILIIIGVKRK